MQKFLIAGLGNIGEEYAGTRHNIGFDLADALAAKHQGVFSLTRHAYLCRIEWRGKLIFVIKPTTFMNLSGKAVKYWLEQENISSDHLLVLVDELALPLSRIRIRPSGSAAGHNGLSSIVESLGSEDFPRLRYGIGNDFPRGGQVDFVLGKWKPEEWPLVQLKTEKCVNLIESFVVQGINRTMNDWNKMEFKL
jgi:PTH1 family peptidyl-tRNA hydrolase